MGKCIDILCDMECSVIGQKMKCGITEVCPDAVRLKDGTLLHEYVMVQEIKQDNQSLVYGFNGTVR